MDRLVQDLHAAISRRNWHDTEVAANAIRDSQPRDIVPAPDQTNAEVSDERLREIEPCPFCGGDARMTYSDRGEIWQVRCNNWTGTAGSKSCMGGGAYAYTEAEAIALWNRRSVTSQASEGEVETAHLTQPQYDAVSEALDFRLAGEMEDDLSRAVYERASEKIAAMGRKILYASPSKRVERLETAKLTGGEIWEFLFGELKGAVPSELSDAVLARLADHITEHFPCSP